MPLALRQIGSHLEPGGRLFLDLANPFVLAQTPNDRLVSLEGIATDPDNGETIALFASNWVDTIEQRLHITWLYDASPAGGGPVHRTVVTTTHRYVYPHELVLWLPAAGLRLDALFGDYEQAPFGEASDRLLALISKPE
jgi:hypothetical protein